MDPAAAARIHVNDPQRIQRALEVYRADGLERSPDCSTIAPPVLEDVEVHGIRGGTARTLDLHQRIEARFEGMMAADMMDEVRELAQERSHCGTSVDARGRIPSGMGLPSGRWFDDDRKAVAATRQLAKRQLTWLRRRRWK